MVEINQLLLLSTSNIILFLALGDICQHRGECSNVPLALCTKFQCTCINKYVQVPTPEPGHDICLPIGEKINDTCIDDIQCTITLGIGSACIDGFCTCKEMYQLKNSINKCVKDMSKCIYMTIYVLYFNIFTVDDNIREI